MMILKERKFSNLVIKLMGMTVMVIEKKPVRMLL